MAGDGAGVPCDNRRSSYSPLVGGRRVTTHRFDPDTFHTTLGQHPPALRIVPGDSVVMQTLDARGVDRAGERRGERPNPQSGPIWVEGAQPGSALEVTIV